MIISLRLLLAPALLLLLARTTEAQIQLPAAFQQQLDALGVEFITPVESDYRDIRPGEGHSFQQYDFAIRSRREGLEIRYLLKPFRPNDPLADFPQINAARILTHLASNNEEVVISALGVNETLLREEFNADWGKVFFFKPKSSFADYQECKMLALYREGVGMAYVFFLFDRSSRELDNRFFALRFKS